MSDTASTLPQPSAVAARRPSPWTLHLEEAYRVGEGVLPVLRRRGLLEAAHDVRGLIAD